MRIKHTSLYKTLALAACAGSFLLTACGGSAEAAAPAADAGTTTAAPQRAEIVTTANTTSGGYIDSSELFTDRDLRQTAELDGAVSYTLKDGQEISITQEGVYVLTGTAKNATVVVEADKEAKVQLVLDGVNVSNEDFPVIYVKSADKVFVTTGADSSLAVTGSFRADGDTNTDAVIFSRADLVLNGTAALSISSSKNGVVCKDDLKVTGGSYAVTAAKKALEANDSICIADGSFALTAGTDALHAENDEDDTLGYICICGGTFVIDAGDDGIHGLSIVQIDGGSFAIRAAEGIEATLVQINRGTVSIEASDDGINGAQKSRSYRPTVAFTGGKVTIVMGAGDTDAVDCNGDLVISGGTVDITARSGFDIDGSISFTGGSVIVNGETVTSIPNQMMGGGQGGLGGQSGQGGFGGPGGMGRRR